MATKKLTCTADVSISEQYSGNAYNGADRLAFGRGAASGDRYWALLKFSSLGLAADTYEITKAVLTVTKISGALGFNAAMNARALRVTSSWSESTTWGSKPSTTTTGQSAVVSMGEGNSGSVNFDVTDIVLAWQGGSSQYGVCLQQSDSTASRIKTIADRTASGAAYITVTYAERKPEPTTPAVTAPGTITADSHTFKWSAATDNIFASSKLSYQLQISLDGGSNWSNTYTAAAGKTSLAVDLRTLAGLKAGQYYYNAKLKARVRAVTPAHNGTVYYSGWGISAAGVVNYKITPGKPSSLTLSASAPYEGQSVTITLGRPSTYNAYDSAGAAMQLTYTVKLKDGTTLGSVTAAATSATASVTVAVPSKTSGTADLSTSVTATVKDAEGQTGAATSAVGFTIKRYRAPAVSVSKIDRTDMGATITATVTDTGYGGTQSNSQITKLEYKLASGSWTTATPVWSGLKASFALSGLDAGTRYALQIRVINTAPSGVTAKTATASGTILEYTPAAMVFKDSANNKTGIATKSLIVGADWEVQPSEGSAVVGNALTVGTKSGETMSGSLRVYGTIASGDKASAGDGLAGVAIGRTGYILIQRGDSGKPYINFYMQNSTTAAGVIQTSGSAMEFRSGGRYDFDARIDSTGNIRFGAASPTTQEGLICYWADKSTHPIVARNGSGLEAYFGWAGSSSYKTVAEIRGQTCKYTNSSGTTTLSDERLKKDFVNLTDWEKFYDRLEPVAFRMKNGNSGRYHMGFKAQQVKEALEDSGLTARDFAGYLEMIHRVDPDNLEGEAAYEAAGIRDGDKELGLIYTEFVALNTHMIKQLRAEMAALKDEVSQLKAQLAEVKGGK